MRVWGIAILLSLSAVLQGCGDATATVSEEENGGGSSPYQCKAGEIDGPGIIGGQRINRSGRIARSTVFLIQESNGGISMCTATLVSRDVLLTAAHCVANGPSTTQAERIKVVFGADPLCTMTAKDMSQVRSVNRLVVHPDWSESGMGTGRNVDLALVHLDSAAPSEMTPMPVATDLPMLSGSESIFIAGFGRTTDLKNSDRGETPFLRIATLSPKMGAPFLSIDNSPTSPRLIFDQSGGQSACSGDSGGPAMMRVNGQLMVIGVASFVADPDRGTASCRRYVVHTNVAYYQRWLRSAFQEVSGNAMMTSRTPFD